MPALERIVRVRIQSFSLLYELVFDLRLIFFVAHFRYR